ncbi:DUF2179 domain-containing protein [Mycoplasma zalophidermidis]|uniref:DUF2179 domain-containing protein n=1 Tax=Mycoplasma zalophidermidis TaxID=398174 RepID=A0ABS6DSD8_9MOLU|nr:DUF2179 domain-containing protein [Mycoplasma zalophidermidis]MBU4689975.1 DUF2179 domain-containing protein [Mycoplasma zalophidermidis]MBU4693911.1 DUF2179 domain-containing protein [Mycoplasma zalophidermidis]
MKKANELEVTRVTEIKRNRIKQSFLHFSTLYRINKLGWQIALSIVIGLIFGVIEFTMIQITGLYQMGLGALAQALGRFTRIFNTDKTLFNILFWLVNFLGNVPLFVFAYKKIDKKFALLNFAYLASSTISGFACASIPGAEHWFIFSDPNTSLPAIDGADVLKNVEIIIWDTANLKEFSIFFYAMLFGILQAIFNAVLLITGSSSAGFDIVAIYMSKKKFRDMGSVFLLIHLVCLIIANLFGTYIPAGHAITGHEYQNFNVGPWAMQNFFSPTFIAGVLMILVNAITLNIFFPKFQLVRVEVISSKVNEIQQAILNCKDKTYATTIVDARGGYSNQKQQILITTCLFIDAAQLLDMIRNVDENAFVTVLDVKKVDGHVYTANTKHKKLFSSKEKRQKSDIELNINQNTTLNN